MSLNSNAAILVIMALTIAAGCTEPSPIDELRWLEGNWKQTNQKKKTFSLETWKYDDGELKGRGYAVVQDGEDYDTIFSEGLRIITREQTLFYEADLPTQEAVLFRLTSSEDDSWNFSNPQHDSPKYITYRKTDEGFTAIVGDGKKENILTFEKL